MPLNFEPLKTMQSNHTPGPWKRDTAEFADWGWIRDPDENLVAKASIPYGTDVDKCRMEKIDPTEHNANLIAAAPELLEALQLLLGCVLMDGDPREGRCPDHPGTSPIAMARAAVTKACRGDGHNANVMARGLAAPESDTTAEIDG